MTKTNLTATIDALGDIKAKIAALELQEKAIKADLIALGEGAYEGELFRVTVSFSERETLDMKAVRAKLSPQFISAHTNVIKVRTVRVTARTGEEVNA